MRRRSPDGRPQGWTAAYERGWDRAFGNKHIDLDEYLDTFRPEAAGQHSGPATAIPAQTEEAERLRLALAPCEVRRDHSSDPVGVWEGWGTLEESKDDDGRS